MKLYLYNQLSKQKELFTPLTPGYVGMYVCGPTVSGESHLGHARPFITFDILYRLLRYHHYQVRYIRNITDAGHFEEEGRDAEDKISTKAFLEKLEPMELVQKYTNLFHQAMRQFNCIEPSIEPTATGHIMEQIEMIEDIIHKGFAYEVNGSVYFDVLHYAKNHHYGILSKRKIEDLLDNTRPLEGGEEKRNPLDFALWKKAPPKHLMKWKSPWGYGFPGWHIECSAMSAKYLGTTFDIHGGGMDLQFPHHECEIAQSTIAHNEPPARYWIHNNMITINGKKMGKSYQNVIKLSELFEGTHPLITKPIHPHTVRFFILQSHYRSTLDFSMHALEAAEKAFHRLWTAYQILNSWDVSSFPISGDLDKELLGLLQKMDEEILDDMNTAKVLALFFDIIPSLYALHQHQISPHALSKKVAEELRFYFKKYLEDIFGLQDPKQAGDSKIFHKTLHLLLDLRAKAKQEKDFSLSDSIRSQLESLGLTIKDNKDGSTDWGYL